MRIIESFKSFKDKWPPCGPFSSMEEVDKVCNELRDMFVEFGDDNGDVKVQVFTRGTNCVNSFKSDNKYTISVGLTTNYNGITSKSFNTNDIYDSVMMSCEYLESFYDFDIEFIYYTQGYPMVNTIEKTKSLQPDRLAFYSYDTKEFPKDKKVVAFYITFKEKINQ